MSVLDFAGKVDGGGVREGQQGEKPNTHFLVKEFLYGIAKVMMHGAKKYAPWNWQRGMKYSDTYSSLQRHLWDWWQREDNDDGPKGSGLPHLWHAGCDLMFLVFYEAHRALYGKFDDRPLKPDEPQLMPNVPAGFATGLCSAQYANTSCHCDKRIGHLEPHHCDCGRRW